MSEPETVPARTPRGRPYRSRYTKTGAAADPPDSGTPRAEAPADPAAFTTDSQQIEIWERRMLNPFGMPALTIHLTQPGWHLRWINTKAYPGRLQVAREQGYLPVRVDELQDSNEVVDMTPSPDGYVCRGERNEEVLMKIPNVVYDRVQKRKAEILRRSYEPQVLKGAMQNAAAGVGIASPEVADTFKGTIKFGTERVTYGEDE